MKSYNKKLRIVETDVLILGAGLTGLSTAYHLGGREYCVLEKENRPGGLCGSVAHNGFLYDYTGHLLHLRNEYAKELIFSFLKNNLTYRTRNTLIHSFGRYTRYPFQANLFGLPKQIIEECIKGLVESKLKYFNCDRKKMDMSFRDWCVMTFGQGISKYFMIPYNEKLWRVSSSNMTTGWTGGYVPQPLLKEVLEGAYTDNKRLYGYNAKFYYPGRGGIQALIDNISENIKNLETSIKIKTINLKQKIVVTNKGIYRYKKLVSTLPLPVFLGIVSDLPGKIKKISSGLKHNSVLDINIGVSGRDVSSGAHWIYFPEKKYSFYRVGFYNNFSRHLCPSGSSSMYVEVSYRNGKINIRQSVKDALSGLYKANILKKNDIIGSVCPLNIKYAYVIYDANRNYIVEKISSYLVKNSVLTTGRFGGWKYSTMEDAVLDGRTAAQWTE